MGYSSVSADAVMTVTNGSPVLQNDSYFTAAALSRVDKSVSRTEAEEKTSEKANEPETLSVKHKAEMTSHKNPSFIDDECLTASTI
ncbi:unnamed protein product, partial [Soboliphyme baturini]|uniref:Uncharacterized protein n=1 Tax=Soboliphyme baturini TaxID=241478 RepID=A0A183IAM2_9BILA